MPEAIKLLAAAPAPPFEAFRDQVLQRMAAAFGLTYEQLQGDLAGAERSRALWAAYMNTPTVTAKMLRLAASRDRRQRKRGWRIFHEHNPHGRGIRAFEMAVFRIQWERAMKQAVAGLARAAAAFGTTAAALERATFAMGALQVLDPRRAH